MINKRIQDYIDDHAFCSEYLFKDWESFLDLLYAEGGRISSILWWDHCKKSQLHESVGSGGYRDPNNAEYIYPRPSCIRKVWKRILLMKSRIISIWREKQVSNMVTNTGATIWCLLSIWRIDKFQFVEETDMNNSMETKYYIVARIDGETKLRCEMLQYEII